MDNHFHYDPAAYHEQVVNIADHVVSNDDAILIFTPRIDVDSNSYHACAIQKAEQERVTKLHPRLYL